MRGLELRNACSSDNANSSGKGRSDGAMAGSVERAQRPPHMYDGPARRRLQSAHGGRRVVRLIVGAFIYRSLCSLSADRPRMVGRRHDASPCGLLQCWLGGAARDRSATTSTLAAVSRPPARRAVMKVAYATSLWSLRQIHAVRSIRSIIVQPLHPLV